jgi:ClpX C4-type zinc finger
MSSSTRIMSRRYGSVSNGMSERGGLILRKDKLDLESGAVLCLEVTINGEQRVLAGVATAETISASVTVHPGFNQAWITVDGEVAPEGQPNADAHWLTGSAALGDVVQIRLVESNAPTAPRLGRIDLSVKARDDIPFVCAFCGKEPKDVQGMLASRKAMICRGCLRELQAIASEQDPEVEG